jgi:hypothetical protein
LCRHNAESDAKEAVALYTFQARNKRELSFTKGDILTLYEKLSNDWWEGVTNDEREGLVPDKYIKLLNRLADRGSCCSHWHSDLLLFLFRCC